VELPKVQTPIRLATATAWVSVLHGAGVPTTKPEEFATDDEAATARARHCADSDNEIEIDEPARVSRGAEGYWVQAWVWVPTES
jgi:hypothetical protein